MRSPRHDFVTIARDFKPFAGLLDSHHGHVREQLLIGRRTNLNATGHDRNDLAVLWLLEFCWFLFVFPTVNRAISILRANSKLKSNAGTHFETFAQKRKLRLANWAFE
jgi:hypothetical protein